jgi:pimeloyl-ACP methyl ester carboxylesterase
LSLVAAKIAVLNALQIVCCAHPFHLPYLFREGAGRPSILFVHGLGGAKENFYWALQSPALADCTLVMLDLPGTGLTEFDPTLNLDVHALSEIAELVATGIVPRPH